MRTLIESARWNPIDSLNSYSCYPILLIYVAVGGNTMKMNPFARGTRPLFIIVPSEVVKRRIVAGRVGHAADPIF